ncbi:MAG: two-component system, OmpR family, alkaline phosphatase synthesis response regulator PhoP [Epulopiscium sp.]|jgi:two-component system alkaline phosphatase synthesis response regulator PhoP|uniref:Stage 0 sporulation protein A homolog n=1 Tax=Defluviitalea raffinosedens TaxID=1450156 RepID=A0A7C8HEM2_9FIRM|nr:response regulator transcription factor [Defluviitalea raffinosedens]MBZ4668279.1 two component transcriptional regulator, winged helix family [Defluviitaleaceae bacterium]MDK2788274.1 two-component system, OmpR family, alkaline phosphatase synthesis response regulator PhoP [Candidatus Epulonipiscium sp.]KAE9634407.1 response regulator [Defluviitalea raffinosedens]MBM7684803.1 two-component system alkaline phosphatase synthesis response regulator PhoP [Defluviitalea raffinosedens]HHW67038.1
MSKRKILIVDDEIHILELLKYNLENTGYEVSEAESGEEALEKLNASVDLVILDLMLPGIDGLEVLKRIRFNESLKNIPVIMLTAKNEEIDAVLGLEMGADDYIGKPFRVRELLARIKAVLRRKEETEYLPQSTEKEKIIQVGNLAINETTRTVKKSDNVIEMPLKEFELLAVLAKNPGRVFSREELLEKIWGYDYVGESRTVDVHIRNLRKKIEDDDSSPFFIKTVRGIGYKFREESK